MGIESVEEMLGVRTAKINSQWQKTYRRGWRVQTTSPLVSAQAVRNACPVQLGKRYEQTDALGNVVDFDKTAFCQSLDVQIDPSCDDDCTWIIIADYGPYDPTQFPENPLNHPIKITFGANRFEKPAEEDVDGNAVLNSAGDYFDPAATMDDSRSTLRVVRNEQYYDERYATVWRDKVNESNWNGYAPGTVKILPITSEMEYSGVCGFYYVVQYEFEINSDGWKKRILDQGLRVLDSGTGNQKLAHDENGQPATSPVLLDGNGGQLEVGDSPVYLEYQVYQEIDFGPLNLNFSGAPGQEP
jgi:hypothetical protein